MCRKLWFLLTISLLSAGLSACRAAPVPAPVSLPDYWPTESWRIDAPEHHDFDPTLPDAIAARIPELPFLDGLLIIRHGYIVHESYYNSYDAGTLHHIASVTKSWTSALLGIALTARESPRTTSPKTP